LPSMIDQNASSCAALDCASALSGRIRRWSPIRRVKPIRSKNSRIWILRLRPMPRLSLNAAA